MADSVALPPKDDDEIEIKEIAEKPEVIELPEEKFPDKQEDKRLSSDLEDDREGIRERRRAERKERKERQRQERNRKDNELQSLRSELSELRQATGHLIGKTTNDEYNRINGQIGDLVNQIRAKDSEIAAAIEAGAGAKAIEGIRVRDDLLYNARKLEDRKTEMERRSKERPRTTRQEENKLPQEVERRMSNFLKKHEWYNPDGGDEDSEILIAIDRSVARAGFEPDTDDYWDEIEDRARARLPHHFKDSKDNDDEPPQRRADTRRSPPVGGGRDQNSTPRLRKNEVLVPPELKKNMIEAGQWDDKKVRDRVLAKYRAGLENRSAAR